MRFPARLATFVQKPKTLRLCKAGCVHILEKLLDLYAVNYGFAAVKYVCQDTKYDNQNSGVSSAGSHLKFGIN